MSIRLNGAGLIEQVFGTWPSFHDAEITEITLQRVETTIFLELLVPAPARSRDSVDLKKEPVRAQYFLAKFVFHECEYIVVENFNYQNVISSLILSGVTEARSTSAADELEDRIKVDIVSIFGAFCSFTCSTGEVLSMTPTHLRIGHPFNQTDNEDIQVHE